MDISEPEFDISTVKRSTRCSKLARVPSLNAIGIVTAVPLGIAMGVSPTVAAFLQLAFMRRVAPEFINRQLWKASRKFVPAFGAAR